MANTFDWVKIRTSNLEPSARYYGDLFGWKITEKESALGSDVWLFDTGSTPRMKNLRRGGFFLTPKSEPMGILVYVVVDDMEATLKRATELGGSIVRGEDATGAGGYSAFIADPTGNVLALYQDMPGQTAR